MHGMLSITIYFFRRLLDLVPTLEVSAAFLTRADRRIPASGSRTFPLREDTALLGLEVSSDLFVVFLRVVFLLTVCLPRAVLVVRFGRVELTVVDIDTTSASSL